MTITAPERQTQATDEDDVVHTWCSTCKTHDPARSVCGLDLDESVPEAECPPSDMKECPRCVELEPLHAALLHSSQ